MLAFQEISYAWENLFFLLYFQFFKSRGRGVSHFSFFDSHVSFFFLGIFTYHRHPCSISFVSFFWGVLASRLDTVEGIRSIAT